MPAASEQGEENGIEKDGMVAVNDEPVAAQATDPGLQRTIADALPAAVTIVADPEFTEALIVGRVYHDKNKNGRADEGEPGIPRATLGLTQGVFVTTDDKTIAGGLAALDKMGGFLRGEAARRLNLRRAPTMVFTHDRTAEKLGELDELLRDDPGKGPKE